MEIVFFFLKPISENLVCEVNNSNKFIQKNIIYYIGRKILNLVLNQKAKFNSKVPIWWCLGWD
ncbi:hypothetical protein VN0637_11820 [Helicobacter pylori]